MTTKNLKIGEETHTQLKTYCAKHKLKLNEWTDKLIQLNFQYPVIVELLLRNMDTEYFREKTKSPKSKGENLPEIQKQIKLMEECENVFIKMHLNKWKPLE